jgi:hypothetical protein
MQGMLVICCLIVAVIVSFIAIVAALMTAPEAYEGKHGLDIVRKTLPPTHEIVFIRNSPHYFLPIPEPTGLEPATSAVTGRRSSQLS